MKIQGLDALTKQFDDAQKAIAELDGELGVVNFNPQDPSSIEAAIKAIEAIIDAKVQPYASNPIVATMVEGMKEQYRQGIIDRAAAARLGEGSND
ncbi:hypothetical protein [Mesorhizobium sp. B2-3-5]|uniref:hypothetical protein n=1 Tax=Mesorhizobium sp. B2-3-5 TaxID=2589958 RepID=UPI0011286904|nr:hypothetical protein [Mesorhizobium sp. B2-3-5]TPM21605.1 hypothetical protein FJ958_25825 [Mesorhizobium sp. B2-3-5]